MKSRKKTVRTNRKNTYVLFGIGLAILSVVVFSGITARSRITGSTRAASANTSAAYTYVRCGDQYMQYGDVMNSGTDVCKGKGQCPKDMVSDMNSPCGGDFLGTFYCCRKAAKLGISNRCVNKTGILDAPPRRPCDGRNAVYTISNPGIIYGGVAQVTACCKDKTGIVLNPTPSTPPPSNTYCGTDGIDCTRMQVVTSLAGGLDSFSPAGAYCYDNATPANPGDDMCVTLLDNLQTKTGDAAKRKTCADFQGLGLSYRKLSNACYFSTKIPVTISGMVHCKYGKRVQASEYTDLACKAAQISYGIN